MATQTQRRKAKTRTRSKTNEAARGNGFKKAIGRLRELAPAGSKLVGSRPARTAVSRLAGEQPSRTRALMTASTVGFGGTVVVYKLLRSGGGDDEK